jgi:hypothetical protein
VQLVERLLEGGAVGAGAAGGLGEHSVAAGKLQGVDLELGMLVGGGDAGIAEQVTHAGERRRTVGQGWLCDVDFGHGFWTPLAALAAGEGWLSQKRSFLDTSPGTRITPWRRLNESSSVSEIPGGSR